MVARDWGLRCCSVCWVVARWLLGDCLGFVKWLLGCFYVVARVLIGGC